MNATRMAFWSWARLFGSCSTSKNAPAQRAKRHYETTRIRSVDFVAVVIVTHSIKTGDDGDGTGFLALNWLRFLLVHKVTVTFGNSKYETLDEAISEEGVDVNEFVYRVHSRNSSPFCCNCILTTHSLRAPLSFFSSSKPVTTLSSSTIPSPPCRILSHMSFLA